MKSLQVETLFKQVNDRTKQNPRLQSREGKIEHSEKERG